MEERKNVLLIHGGGLVDSSKAVILTLVEFLKERNVYDKYFIGYYSFESLLNVGLIHECNDEYIAKMWTMRGTCFGTCRKLVLNDELVEEAAQNLKSLEISTIIVCGGDGSARQVAECHASFEKHGINIIFPIPLTIDGINGGEFIGIDQAVREAVRQIENVCATSLETRTNRTYGVVVAQMQGRNRDDIAAYVAYHFVNSGKIADRKLYIEEAGESIEPDDIVMRIVPINFKIDAEKLVNEVKACSNRMLIILAEYPPITVDEIKAKTGRAIRTVAPGYSLQSNNLTTDDDVKRYEAWISDVTDIISSNCNTSYCICKIGSKCEIMPIDYYAILNPANGGKDDMPAEVLNEMKKYFPR